MFEFPELTIICKEWHFSRQRQEMEIRLKKEEEDRLVRRKRVEAIMSRTRGKGSTPANTPTKVFLFIYFPVEIHKNKISNCVELIGMWKYYKFLQLSKNIFEFDSHQVQPFQLFEYFNL